MSSSKPPSTPHADALDRARRKAYWHLLPLLFVSYMIAYVDRQNVAVAKLTMTRDLPGFDNAVIGFGAGIFYIGYVLLEIPGTLMVERWSARKWICRIMVTWGMMAGLTAAVTSPWQFYTVRFLLGLAEAGFFPGVIVYLTHWFPSRDRARALAIFLVAAPLAQILSPFVSFELLKIGADAAHPILLGLVGWQWVYVFWALPAVLLGAIVFYKLTDHPAQAAWLTSEEKTALEGELERERGLASRGRRMTVLEALSHPRVLLLAVAYFCMTTGSIGMELFMTSILKDWYHLKDDTLKWLIILPPAAALVGQLVAGWSSDRYKERRWHAVVPIVLGSASMGLLPQTQGNMVLTVVCFMAAFTGFKSYMPAFWALPSMFLTSAAAAGSIGLINSLGNLGGAFGSTLLGTVEKMTGSYVGGLYYMCCSALVSAAIIFSFGLAKKDDTSGQ